MPVSVRGGARRYGPLVKAALGVVGVPGPVLHGLDAAVQVAGLSADQDRLVRAMAEQATTELETYSGREFLQVGEADKEHVQTVLAEALMNPLRAGLLVAAVQGREALRAYLRAEPGLAGVMTGAVAGDEAARYLDGLLDRVSVLVTGWVRSEPVRGLATLESVATVLSDAGEQLHLLGQVRADLADLADHVHTALTAAAASSGSTTWVTGPGAVGSVTQKIHDNGRGYAGGSHTHNHGAPPTPTPPAPTTGL